MARKLFDYISDINYKELKILTTDMGWKEEDDRDYNSFVVNRTLSYFSDTVAFANEMNFRAHTPPKSQFDFLINTVRKRKRFAKWIKPIIGSDLEVIKKYYECNTRVANMYLFILTTEEVDELREKVSKGGRVYG